MESSLAMLPILFVFAIIGLIVWAVVHFTKRQQERFQVVWGAVAERLGGQFSLPSGPWYRKSPMNINAVVSGVSAFVDHYTVSTGKSSVTYTRIRAVATGAGSLDIKIYKEHVFSTLGKALGFQDVEVGDPEFDRVFIIKANEEDLARVWIQPDARNWMLQATTYNFTVKQANATAIRTGIETNPELLEAAIRAIATLASSGKTLLHQWEQVAAETGGSLSERSAWTVDSSLLQTESRGISVTIDTPQRQMKEILGAPSLYTRIRARLVSSETKPFAAFYMKVPKSFETFSPVQISDTEFMKSYRIVGNDADNVQQRLSSDITGRLLRLGPSAVIVDEEYVNVFFPGMETTPERLQTTVELVGEIATPPSRGPYR